MNVREPRSDQIVQSITKELFFDREKLRAVEPVRNSK